MRRRRKRYTTFLPATCIITAKGYKPLTLTLDKSNHKVTIGAVEETTYKAYVEKAENGSVSLSASEGIKKGETVTVTVTQDVDYELDTLTVKTESKEVETKKVSETSYTFAMPAANVTVTAKFKASALKVVDIDKVTLTEDTFGNDWHINFSEPSDYVENVIRLFFPRNAIHLKTGNVFHIIARLPKMKYLSEAAMSSPFPQKAMKT